MKNKAFIVSICLGLFLGGCNPNIDQQTVIPFTPVDVMLFTSDPLFIDLNFPGGSVYLNGGSRGIIVYRLDQDNFMAFDRHCTYEVSNPCGVIDVNANLLLEDYCCGSQFLITDGSVFEGPAQVPLHRYRTSFDGNTLRIFN